MGSRFPAMPAGGAIAPRSSSSQGPTKARSWRRPEYEGTQAFSCQIGNNDVDVMEWLNHVNDGLGMDLKEQAWVLGMAMECYNKGLITKKDTDGVDLTWGNVEGVEAMMNKIARRDGLAMSWPRGS